MAEVPHAPVIAPPWNSSQKELQQQLDAEKAGREDETKGAATRQSEAEAKIAELERMKGEMEAARAELVRGGVRETKGRG